MHIKNISREGNSDSACVASSHFNCMRTFFAADEHFSPSDRLKSWGAAAASWNETPNSSITKNPQPCLRGKTHGLCACFLLSTLKNRCNLKLMLKFWRKYDGVGNFIESKVQASCMRALSVQLRVESTRKLFASPHNMPTQTIVGFIVFSCPTSFG